MVYKVIAIRTERSIAFKTLSRGTGSNNIMIYAKNIKTAENSQMMD